MAKYKKEQIDAIGRRYRTMPAALTQSEVANQLQVPLSTLRTWIEKFGWERDLSDEVLRRTNIAVQKARLGADLDKPLTDEEAAITERVALNVALIEAHQEWLNGFGQALNILKDKHLQQVQTMTVAIECSKAASGYRVVVKNLGSAIADSRNLIATFKEFQEQQRLAYGISPDSQGDAVDVDTYLRELAEEMAQEDESKAGSEQ